MNELDEIMLACVENPKLEKAIERFCGGRKR